MRKLMSHIEMIFSSFLARVSQAGKYLGPNGKKIIDMPGGQINDPLSGVTIICSSSLQLHRVRSGPLKGFLS